MSEDVGKQGRKQVEINGVLYPSYTAAGRAYGVTRQAILSAIKNNTLDRLGMGSRTGLEAGWANANRKTPITILGVTYESHKAAYESLGVSEGTFCYAQKTNRLEELFRTGKLSNLNPRGPKSVTIDGKPYGSISEAAKATGIPYARIANGLREGRLQQAVNNYRNTVRGRLRLDRLGLLGKKIGSPE